MTIKELHAITPSTQKLSIVDGFGNLNPLNRDDPVALAAFGDFAIQSIQVGEKDIEITIQMTPVKLNS